MPTSAPGPMSLQDLMARLGILMPQGRNVYQPRPQLRAPSDVYGMGGGLMGGGDPMVTPKPPDPYPGQHYTDFDQQKVAQDNALRLRLAMQRGLYPTIQGDRPFNVDPFVIPGVGNPTTLDLAINRLKAKLVGTKKAAPPPEKPAGVDKDALQILDRVLQERKLKNE